MGVTCIYCDEEIKRGEVVNEVGQLPNGNKRPIHKECGIRSIIGSVAHQQRRCSCYVPGAEEGDDPKITRREAAVAAYNYWVEHKWGGWSGKNDAA